MKSLDTSLPGVQRLRNRLPRPARRDHAGQSRLNGASSAGATFVAAAFPLERGCVKTTRKPNDKGGWPLRRQTRGYAGPSECREQVQTSGIKLHRVAARMSSKVAAPTTSGRRHCLRFRKRLHATAPSRAYRAGQGSQPEGRLRLPVRAVLMGGRSQKPLMAAITAVSVKPRLRKTRLARRGQSGLFRKEIHSAI
jgi:hypothetical protein